MARCYSAGPRPGRQRCAGAHRRHAGPSKMSGSQAPAAAAAAAAASGRLPGGSCTQGGYGIPAAVGSAGPAATPPALRSAATPPPAPRAPPPYPQLPNTHTADHGADDDRQLKINQPFRPVRATACDQGRPSSRSCRGPLPGPHAPCERRGPTKLQRRRRRLPSPTGSGRRWGVWPGTPAQRAPGGANLRGDGAPDGRGGRNAQSGASFMFRLQRSGILSAS